MLVYVYGIGCLSSICGCLSLPTYMHVATQRVTGKTVYTTFGTQRHPRVDAQNVYAKLIIIGSRQRGNCKLF